MENKRHNIIVLGFVRIPFGELKVKKDEPLKTFSRDTTPLSPGRLYSNKNAMRSYDTYYGLGFYTV